MSILFTFRRFSIVLALTSLLGCGGKKNHPSYTPAEVEREWDIHHDAERDERKETALSGYRDMCGRTPPYIRACYDYARLLFELVPVSKAQEEIRKTILRFPNDALAQSAIKRLRRSFSDEVEKGIRELTVLAEKTIGKECHDTVLFEIARLAKSSDNTPVETATLKQLLDRFDRWESQLWDDAAWRLANIYRETEDVEAEKRTVKALLDTRERSRLIGSYTSPFHDDALLRLGEIQLAEGKTAQALKTFMELGGQEKSRLREDGLLAAARIKRSLGDSEAACRLLQEILGRDANRHTRREAQTLAHNAGCAF